MEENTLTKKYIALSNYSARWFVLSAVYASHFSYDCKKGVSHPHDQGVLWIKIENDGHRKIKGKRLPDPKVPNDLERVKPLIPSFIVNPNIQVENIPEFQKVATIDFNDPEPELIPEAYLDENIPTITEIQQGVEDTVRDTVAFLIRSKQEEVISNEWNKILPF